MNKLLFSLSNLNEAFWKRIVSSTEQKPESLYVFRIIVGIYTLFICFPNFTWLGTVPQILFTPPKFSIAFLFDGFPNSIFFVGINILLLLLNTFITIGLRARLSTICFVSLYIFANSFQFSLGKIDHLTMLYLVLLCCLCFTNFGCGLSVLPDKELGVKTGQKAFSLLSVCICFAFFSAGFAKALNWINLDLESNGVGSWYYNKLYLRRYLLAPYLLKSFPFLGFKLLDYIAVIFELSAFLFLLKSRQYWNTWLLFACIFHLTNLLIFNVDFLPLAIVYLSFVDFSMLYHPLQKVLKIKLVMYLFFAILIIVFGMRMYQIVKNESSLMLFINVQEIELSLYVSVLVWAIIACILVREIFIAKRKCLKVLTIEQNKINQSTLIS